MIPLNWGRLNELSYVVIFWTTFRFIDAWTTPFLTSAERIVGEAEACAGGERVTASNNIRTANMMRRVKEYYPLAISIRNESLKGSRVIGTQE